MNNTDLTKLNGAELIVTAFVDLYAHASDSIQAQDALMAFYRKMGILCGTWELSDTEAWDAFDDIRQADLPDTVKDAYLSALDVVVQNHHWRGLAAPILYAIRAEQSLLVLRMARAAKQLGTGNPE